MGLQAFWYVAQWGFFVAGVHLFNMLMQEDDWREMPAEAQRRARERRASGKKGQSLTMLDNLYYTLDMAWYWPIILYILALACAVAAVILFVSVAGIGNDLYWPVEAAPLSAFVVLMIALSYWIPWFYRKCQSRCTEQYLQMFGLFLYTTLLCVWFILHDIIAGCLLIPLAIVTFIVFLFVFLSEYRCENIDRPRLSMDCQLYVTESDGSTRILIGK